MLGEYAEIEETGEGLPDLLGAAGAGGRPFGSVGGQPL